MAHVFVEHRSLHAGTSLSWDIAHHLWTRDGQGPVLICTEKPVSMLAAVRKQWSKLTLQLVRERAGMLRSPLASVISQKLLQMQGLHFTAQPSTTMPLADVYFCSPDKLVVPDYCHTLYLIGCVPPNLAEAMNMLPAGALVAVYGHDVHAVLLAAGLGSPAQANAGAAAQNPLISLLRQA